MPVLFAKIDKRIIRANENLRIQYFYCRYQDGVNESLQSKHSSVSAALMVESATGQLVDIAVLLFYIAYFLGCKGFKENKTYQKLSLINWFSYICNILYS